MKLTYPLPPNLPEQLPLLTNCQLEDEAILENHLYQQIDLSNQEVRNLVFRDAVFDHLSLANGQFASFDCSNVRFEACDFSNVEWLSGSFHRVTFLRCNLTGTNFADSYLKDCLFEDCKADYASFRFANFNLVHFNQTRLVESEFFEVTWKKLLLEACDLTESNWLNTSLKGLDFSQNTFERLTFSPNYLSGLKVTPEQAIYLASALGLVIT